MARARRGTKISAHGPGREGASRGTRAYCRWCRGPHSKSKHWSHKKAHLEKYFGRTTQPLLSRHGGTRDLRRKRRGAEAAAPVLRRKRRGGQKVLSEAAAKKLAKGGITRKEAKRVGRLAKEPALKKGKRTMTEKQKAALAKGRRKAAAKRRGR